MSKNENRKTNQLLLWVTSNAEQRLLDIEYTEPL